MIGQIRKCSGQNRASDNKASRLLASVLIIVMISPFFASCEKKKKVEQEKHINVQVWTSEIRTVQPFLETTGTLKPYEEVIVSSEVDGIIKIIHVEQGAAVNRGTILSEVNETDYVLDRRRADAALKQSEATLANTRAEHKRKEALFKEELITKQQFDDISTRITLAEADLERAKASLEISKERLSRTKTYSPLQAAVKERRVSVGDYVRNGTPLFQLIKTDPLKLSFAVSEKDVASLKVGQEVVFTVEAIKDRTFKGKVSLLYPNIEERTRTLQAEALVPNAGQFLKPGSFVRLQIYTQAPRQVVVAPLTALLYEGGNIRIFVNENSKARERIVKVGGKYGEFVEVVEGLKEKEQVVVVGQSNLAEGVKINVAR